MRRTICVVLGTRPEAIKMAPVIADLRTREWAKVVVINTAQHRDMVMPVLDLFGLQVDYDLDVMTHRQSLGTLTARLIQGLEQRISCDRPDVILAQGDTTTVLAASLVAFYNLIPFGHVEAGLRSRDIGDPFPEEFNRVVADLAARWMFVPTRQSRDHLLRESHSDERIFVTGNTVIDALLTVRNRAVPNNIRARTLSQNVSVKKSDLLLVTLHRRENHGARMSAVCDAILRLVSARPNLSVVLPVHPNPSVSELIHSKLGGIGQISLVPPLEYTALVDALDRCTLVLTDSGGIQEEAPALGKPVLVARSTTERPEAIHAGVAELVGTDENLIVNRVSQLLDDPSEYKRMARGASPYGDGRAAARIGDILAGHFGFMECRAPTADFQGDPSLVS